MLEVYSVLGIYEVQGTVVLAWAPTLGFFVRSAKASLDLI